jgi:hypothetical protein
MRRTPLVLVGLLALAGAVTACSDDDEGSGAGPTTQEQISTEGVCAVLDPDRASDVMGVHFDKAIDADGSCTYTSTTSQTAFTLQSSRQPADQADLVLETLGASCDPDTREARTFRGTQGGFSCLAGGIPNVVAVGGGVVLVLTGNSRDEGTTPEEVAEDLIRIMGDAVAASIPES